MSSIPEYIFGSDLKLKLAFIINGQRVKPDTVPFDIRVWTFYPSQAKTASYDGENWINCKMVEDYLEVFFDAPQFTAGRLNADITLHYPDDDFPDKIRDKIVKVRLDNPLVNPKTNDVIITGEISDTIAGLSAYGVAVWNGFEGTEKEWLLTLKQPAIDAAAVATAAATAATNAAAAATSAAAAANEAATAAEAAEAAASEEAGNAAAATEAANTATAAANLAASAATNAAAAATSAAAASTNATNAANAAAIAANTEAGNALAATEAANAATAAANLAASAATSTANAASAAATAATNAASAANAAATAATNAAGLANEATTNANAAKDAANAAATSATNAVSSATSAAIAANTATENANTATTAANNAAAAAVAATEAANAAAQRAEEAAIDAEDIVGSKIDKTSITQDLGDSETDIMSQKAVTDELSTIEAGIITNTNDIRTLENTLNSANINQETTATVTGVDTVALPKTAANTGMQVQLFGESNETSNVLGTGRIRSVNSAGLFPSYLYFNGGQLSSNGLIKDEIRKGVNGYELVKRISYTILNGSEDWKLVTSLTLTNTIAFSLKSVGIRNKNGNRSSFWVNTTSGISANDTEVMQVINDDNLYIRINKSRLSTLDVPGFKAWLTANNQTLNYELATPNITPIPHAGLLNSNSNGTAYFEPIIADAGVYSTNLAVQLTDYLIASFESIRKYANGTYTKLNTATAIIAGDGLSFTHPDLVSGDLVMFTYSYANESIGRSMTLTHYDSRFVEADTANGKVYRIVPVITNGVVSWTTVEV